MAFLSSTAENRLQIRAGTSALIDGTPDAKVTVTDIVQKLVFQDEEGNTISGTSGSLIGKIIKAS